MANDPFKELKAKQRDAWAAFVPLTSFTTTAAASLAEFAGVRAEESVLDVGCGTGVVAITAARKGARVTGLDLTPALLEVARRNAAISGTQIEFSEGDVETLPYADASFDVVLSQFGHMFAPRPQAAATEMLRVTNPGGRIAFSTWPPGLIMARVFTLAGDYDPPPPGAAAPSLWGDQNVVRERLGDAVTAIAFNFDDTMVPALSPQHFRANLELSVAPVSHVVERLADQPARLAAFRSELDVLIGQYFSRNHVRLTFIMTRATRQ